jgi:hypothetical protein
MSVRRAKTEIDSPEFTAWQAFDAIHPIGDIRADVGFARVCGAITGTKPADHFFTDNLPRVWPTSDELESRCRAAVLMWNARPRPRRKHGPKHR